MCVRIWTYIVCECVFVCVCVSVFVCVCVCVFARYACMCAMHAENPPFLYTFLYPRNTFNPILCTRSAVFHIPLNQQKIIDDLKSNQDLKSC